jgi:hypothetical protein
MGFGFGSDYGGSFKEISYKSKKDINIEFKDKQIKETNKDQAKIDDIDKDIILSEKINRLNKEKIEKNQKDNLKEEITDVSKDLKVDLNDKIKKQNMDEIKNEKKKEIRKEIEENIRYELKEKLQNEVKEELKLELNKEVREELKKNLFEDTKLELKNELQNEVKEEINDVYSDLNENLHKITKELDNSKFCYDITVNILNELKENDYPFKKENIKDLTATLGYLSSVICSPEINKEHFSEIVKIKMDVIKDNILDFKKYISDDVFENLFDKYNIISEHKDLKIENKDLREKQKNLSVKLKELIHKEEISAELNQSKSLDSKFFKEKLCSPELIELYENYHMETNLNINSGLKFTQKFKKYINDSKDLSYSEKEKLRKKVEIIANENGIEKYILYYLANTTYKIDKIINKIKDIKGLTTSFKTVKELEKKYNLEDRETYRDSKIHPNLNRDYFNVIDTKEKAYLLGFLYADGWVVLRKNESKIMGINVNPKDESIIDYFMDSVNANISKKAYYTDNRGRDIVHIDICDQRFCKALIKQGIVPKKSNIIEYPNFDDKEKSLSFLMGFFDGDGTQGTTRITCGSKKFLEQIKEHYNLPYKIDKDKRKKNCYFSHLGAELFNEMLDNFSNSLPRKRIRLCTEEERLERSKKGSSIKRLSGILSNVKKEELEELVWKKPLKEIGKLYGCSGRAISKKCDKFGIKKPPLGYWKKLKK